MYSKGSVQKQSKSHVTRMDTGQVTGEVVKKAADNLIPHGLQPLRNFI